MKPTKSGIVDITYSQALFAYICIAKRHAEFSPPDQIPKSKRHRLFEGISLDSPTSAPDPSLPTLVVHDANSTSTNSTVAAIGLNPNTVLFPTISSTPPPQSLPLKITQELLSRNATLKEKVGMQEGTENSQQVGDSFLATMGRAGTTVPTPDPPTLPPNPNPNSPPNQNFNMPRTRPKGILPVQVVQAMVLKMSYAEQYLKELEATRTEARSAGDHQKAERVNNEISKLWEQGNQVKGTLQQQIALHIKAGGGVARNAGNQSNLTGGAGGDTAEGSSNPMPQQTQGPGDMSRDSSEQQPTQSEPSNAMFSQTRKLLSTADSSTMSRGIKSITSLIPMGIPRLIHLLLLRLLKCFKPTSHFPSKHVPLPFPKFRQVNRLSNI
ncbi:hypothetical protein VNI00_005164 [Paramarasmius palmivorus]|uniref:Uncharacterized protein n=1 Tax=Paramarasmius palmivorus TaxID=297713 RepID=A0AAW0DIE3_9AGAR